MGVLLHSNFHYHLKEEKNRLTIFATIGRISVSVDTPMKSTIYLSTIYIVFTYLCNVEIVLSS